VTLKPFRKALIVDDDSDLCMMLKTIISDVVPVVQSAETITAAKQILEQFSPDVVFLDNNLPDGQGMHLVKDIKLKYPDAYVIFITAIDSQRETAMKNGIDVYLEKPFTFSAIHQLLTQGSREPEVNA
jgi:response regulator of citrate/malate metabolism